MCYMDYQRIIGWPALCRVYFTRGISIKGIPAKSVYRLRRECHKAALLYNLCRSFQYGIIFCGITCYFLNYCIHKFIFSYISMCIYFTINESQSQLELSLPKYFSTASVMASAILFLYTLSLSCFSSSGLLKNPHSAITVGHGV